MQAVLKTKVQGDNEHQNIGIQILIKACEAPFRAIMENAGLTPDVIWNNIISTIKDGRAPHTAGNKNIGYDARNEKIVDMMEAGIIDPCKVTTTALQKAASVAGTILTTECVVTLIKENDKAVTGPGQMSMM
jgi:chaperonin GroEL